MATGDIWHVSCRYLVRGVPQSFGICYTVQTDPTDPNDGDYLAEAFYVHIDGALRPVQTTDTEYNGIRAQPIYQEERMSGHHFLIANAGQHAGDALPTLNSAVFTLHQTAGAPKNNGRIYVGGNPESETEDNTWKAAYAALLDTLATSFAATVAEVSAGPGRWDPCVLSKTFTPAGTPKGTALDVTSVSASPQVARQSRRRNRFGQLHL